MDVRETTGILIHTERDYMHEELREDSLHSPLLSRRPPLVDVSLCLRATPDWRPSPARTRTLSLLGVSTGNPREEATVWKKR